MEDKVKIVKIFSNDVESKKDTFIILSSCKEFKTQSYLIKMKAPNYFSKFFREINEGKLKTTPEYNLGIEEIIDWYSNLDEQIKTGITSFNNKELVDLICKEIILDKFTKSKPTPKDELKPKSQNSFTCNDNDTYTEELYEQERPVEEDSLCKNTEFQNLEMDDEITKDTENDKEQYINKDIIKEEVFLKYTKICSLKDDADTLIFNIKSKELEECLYYFPKKDSTIKPIIPEYIKKNIWHITLPDSKLLETLSFYEIIACTFILLHFEYYDTHKKIYEMPLFKELGDFFKNNELIMNYLSNNNFDVTNDIFNQYNLYFIAEKCSSNYIKNFINEDQEFDSDVLKDFIINILKRLKNNFSKTNSNEEKLIEKVSFYSLYDVIYSKHFIYREIRNDLKLNQNIDAVYRNIMYNNGKLKEIRHNYLEKTKKLLKEILGQKIDIIEYGSYATDLCTEFSDMDILIFDEGIKNQKNYGTDLVKALNKKIDANAIIKDRLRNKDAPPVITISYDVSKEKVLNELNFSFKYLDEKRSDLNKISIDITFTNNKLKVINTKKTTKIIKDSLEKYKQLKPVILYLKTFFWAEKAYSIYQGGINSLSIYSLCRNIFVIYELNHFDVNAFSNGLILYFISKKFGHYEYLFGIDKDGKDYPLNYIPKVYHIFVINNPADNKHNIASGFHNPDRIIAEFGLLFNYIMEGKDIFLPA